MQALPEMLALKTVYVVCTGGNVTPLFHFVHNKACAAEWLACTAADHPASNSRLARVPTYARLTVPPLSQDPRWPNLVVKLADAGVPDVFRASLPEQLLQWLGLGKARALYQPFVPADTIDGRAWLIRLHAFVSPLCSAFLSAHGVVAGAPLPERLPNGLVADQRPYVVNYSGGAYYSRPDARMEEELGGVALEFDRLAKIAITARFETNPSLGFASQVF